MNEEVRSIAEQCSKPNMGINELSLIQLRPYVESFLDMDWLSCKFKEYENWALKNSDPFLQCTLLHSPPGFNMIAASLWAARDWENIHKEEPSFRPPAGAKRLIYIGCSLATIELNAGDLLDQKAREYLRQRLQHAENLWGAIHELQTFAFFIRRGAKVEPHFLKEASPQEITVHWGGVDIPIQCKVKLPGAGRVISQSVFTSLACCIARDAKVKRQKLLVRIVSTGSIRHEDIEFLRKQVLSGVVSGIGPALVTNKGRTFTVRTQPLSGNFTVKTVINYLSSFNFHISMVVGEPLPDGDFYDVVAIVGIEANFHEKPWNSLLSSIEKAAKQLKGGPPGIICIHYIDPVKDFETLRPNANPLALHLGKLLTPRPHIGAVLLSSEPDLQLPGSGDSGRFRIYFRQPWSFPKDFLNEAT